MTIDRALNILMIQLAGTEMDGRKMDFRKKGYMDALKVAIEVLKEKVEAEQEKEYTE